MQYTNNENSSAAENASKKTKLVHDTDNVISTEHLKITVSKKTFAYIKCLKQFDILWDCVFDTLALSYGTIGAETIMYEENYDKYRSIRSFIKEQFYMSIENDISDKDLIIEESSNNI